MSKTKKSYWRRAVRLIVFMLMIYLVLAYLLVPACWKRHHSRHPALDDLPRITRTASQIPGDPLNLALIGTEADVLEAMLVSGWHPADPLTLRSSLRIARTTVLRQAYDTAPVSHLYLWGRAEDLAFQQPVGGDPRKRHHVRFWRSGQVDVQDRPLWAGAATYDERVGFSRTTGQITHFISEDVDAERDYLLSELQRAGALTDTLILEGYHQKRTGKNGGGNPWRTDGDVKVGVLIGR